MSAEPAETPRRTVLHSTGTERQQNQSLLSGPLCKGGSRVFLSTGLHPPPGMRQPTLAMKTFSSLLVRGSRYFGNKERVGDSKGPDPNLGSLDLPWIASPSPEAVLRGTGVELLGPSKVGLLLRVEPPRADKILDPRLVPFSRLRRLSPSCLLGTPEPPLSLKAAYSVCLTLPSQIIKFFPGALSPSVNSLLLKEARLMTVLSLAVSASTTEGQSGETADMMVDEKKYSDGPCTTPCHILPTHLLDVIAE